MVDLAKEPASRAKLFSFIAIGLIIVFALPYGGWRFYQKWETRRLVKRARILFETGDAVGAGLTIRHAFGINPDDIAANRLLAEYAERSANPAAVMWRCRLLQFQPGSLAAAIECARTSLRFGQPTVARDALEKLKGAGASNPVFHNLSGRTAAALNQPNLAVEEFAEAVRLDPRNDSLHLDYATELLNRGWLEERAVARQIVERLSENPKLRAVALRTLVADSVKNGELTNATSLARKLVETPGASFSDQMTLIDLLRRTGGADFSTAMAPLKASARGNATNLAELLLWMNRTGQSRDGIEWADGFSVQEWSDPGVCAAAALCDLALKDWSKLEAITNGDWENLEYLRCALHARALRERGAALESEVQWQAAMGAIRKQPRSAAALAQVIVDWHWELELEELLRVALDDPTQSEWAAVMLLPRLVKRKNTEGLLDLTSRMMRSNPSNDAAANNFAMYSLLLGRNVTQACEIARDLYAKHPREAKYVSTYAYSLHVRGLSQEALQIMTSLGPEPLKAPDLAAYFGVMLAAAGEREQAAKFLDWADGADLLPEEQELIRGARRQLQ